MSVQLPVPNLIAPPGRRRATLEIAREIGFRQCEPLPYGRLIGSASRGEAQRPQLLHRHRIRTCISDDEAEAKAVLWRTVTNYALMPNYRNYWKEAGYVEEMTAIERAVAEGRADEIARYLPERWIADIPLFGPAAKVREGVEAWRAAGIRTPVLVPLSAMGTRRPPY